MFLNDLSENPNIHPALQGILHSGVFLVSNPLNSFVCVRVLEDFPPQKGDTEIFPTPPVAKRPSEPSPLFQENGILQDSTAVKALLHGSLGVR